MSDGRSYIPRPSFHITARATQVRPSTLLPHPPDTSARRDCPASGKIVVAYIVPLAHRLAHACEHAYSRNLHYMRRVFPACGCRASTPRRVGLGRAHLPDCSESERYPAGHGHCTPARFLYYFGQAQPATGSRHLAVCVPVKGWATAALRRGHCLLCQRSRECADGARRLSRVHAGCPRFSRLCRWCTSGCSPAVHTGSEQLSAAKTRVHYNVFMLGCSITGARKRASHVSAAVAQEPRYIWPARGPGVSGFW